MKIGPIKIKRQTFIKTMTFIIAGLMIISLIIGSIIPFLNAIR